VLVHDDPVVAGPDREQQVVDLGAACASAKQESACAVSRWVGAHVLPSLAATSQPLSGRETSSPAMTSRAPVSRISVVFLTATELVVVLPPMM
jgi:hypothetical protein